MNRIMEGWYQYCHQCKAPHASYYKGTDEYLCAECEDFARTLIATQEALEETDASEQS
jgi:hypothetical protein